MLAAGLADKGRIFFENLSWRDLPDIALATFLLYEVLKIIRGSQAMQLLFGLASLFAIGVIAQALHLRLLEFIFASGGQAILIAAIILFQPELRRALDEVGRFSRRAVLRQHVSEGITRIVEEVIRAAASLSERRTGALVVFERETGLENIVGTGVRIDGAVTAEMLATIFFPNAPLHDGAVVIRDDVLVAAGCVLPLADIAGVGRMGTRHRAALGLTLQTDAVVLIVSEETGLVSVAHRGKIYRGLDQEKLLEMMVTLLGDLPTGGGRRSLPRPFLRTGVFRTLTRR